MAIPLLLGTRCLDLYRCEFLLCILSVLLLSSHAELTDALVLPSNSFVHFLQQTKLDHFFSWLRLIPETFSEALLYQ